MTERNTGSLTRRTLALTEDDNKIVASWVHPIKRLRAKRWNKLIHKPYTGYSVGIKRGIE